MFIRKGIVGGLLLSLILGGFGCGYNQDIKDVWKGTRSFFYRNVSVPASIDYDETGSMSEYKEQLALSMIGIDVQLTNLEKIMNNADKPPTNEWVEALFNRFPWLSGFTGVKSDGTILGQVPSVPLKPLDFTPLLHADDKQNLRAVRGHVQNTPMGPEVFLAAPLYDAHDFLGIVSVYFDMRELLQFSDSPDDLVILSPQAVLWPGKYNFSSTPLAGVAWGNVVQEASSGTISNAAGEFYWSVRYLGNLPIIFAVAVEGGFGEMQNARTGPIDATGFVEPEPVIYEPLEPSETSTEEGTNEAGQDADSSKLSPISPDTSSTEVEQVEEAKPAPKPAQAKPRSKPRPKPAPVYIPPAPMPAPDPVVTPSPIHPDQPDEPSTDTTDSTSVESGSEDSGASTDSTPTETTTPDTSSSESTESTSTSSDTSDSDSAGSDEGDDFARPSPFGPQ